MASSLLESKVYSFFCYFQRIDKTKFRWFDAEYGKGMGDAANNVRCIMADQGMIDEIIFHAGIPVFAEFVGFTQKIPGYIGIFEFAQIFFRRLDIKVMLVL